MKKRLLSLLLFSGIIMCNQHETPMHSHSKLPVGLEKEHPVKVRYVNWRGEEAIRSIIPVDIYWGKTEWHPEEQWILKVWDVEREAYREYSLKDIKEWLP